MIRRRTFLAGLSLGCASLMVGCATKTSRMSAVGQEELRPLPIPPLADSSLGQGRRVFPLHIQRGTFEILPGKHTPTWGFNGPFLGPTVRISRGEKVDLVVSNDTDEDTAVHFHGMLLPADMDGGPHSAIAAGESWTSSFTVEQPAATLWYHPHAHGKTGLQAYRGMAGMIIVDDEISAALELPNTYGVDDIPLVLMDANFHEDGSFDETLDPVLGLQGTVILVNGISGAKFDASTNRVRFRILNGSNMRFHNLALDDDREFAIIATDSGFLAKPRMVRNAQLGPGGRVEIVVDLKPGETIALMSKGFADNLGVPEDANAPDFKLQEQNQLLAIHALGQGGELPPLPTVLDDSADAPLDLEGAIHRSFELDTFSINGQQMDMSRVDFLIDHSLPEVWTVTNGNSDWIHNFHIHNSSFQVLEISGTGVEFDVFGWKDTVTVPPGATVKLAVLFGQYRNNHYPYMYHCHMLYHEDSGMMGQFMMVNKGEIAQLDTAFTRHHHH